MTEALFGLLGVLAGAVLQYWLNQRAGRQSHFLELKSSAYADYLNSVARVAFAFDDDRAKALENVTAAKSRICVFGDARVVNSIVELESTSLDLAKADAQRAFKSLIKVMRKHGVASGIVEDEALDILLFGRREARLTTHWSGRG